MRSARPLPVRVDPDRDGQFPVTLRDFSTHRKVIVRDDDDDSVMWESNWAAANATQDEGGMWTVNFPVPRQRLSHVRTAKLAGRAIVIELWLRHPWSDEEEGTSGTVDVLEFGLDLRL